MVDADRPFDPLVAFEVTLPGLQSIAALAFATDELRPSLELLPAHVAHGRFSKLGTMPRCRPWRVRRLSADDVVAHGFPQLSDLRLLGLRQRLRIS